MKQILTLLIFSPLVLSGCRQNMVDQPKFLPNQQNIYFPKELADREPVAHAVARSEQDDGSPFYTGKAGSGLATDFPLPVTADLVAKGREQFEINCSVCHGRDGYGDGMVVERGFPRPPSYHSALLRAAPVGYFFQVITNGYGAMYPFGSRLSPGDRWAIVSYIRALQFSQQAPVNQLETLDQDRLEKLK